MSLMMALCSGACIRPPRRASLHGLLAHLDGIGDRRGVEPLLAWEEDERARRFQERRLRNARLVRFKSIADFGGSWPTR